MDDCNITTPRNILFVFDEQNNFAFKTCMVEYWRRVVMDGEILTDSQLSPVDALPEDIPGILESVNVGAITRVAELTARVAELEQEAQAMQAQIAALTLYDL